MNDQQLSRAYHVLILFTGVYAVLVMPYMVLSARSMLAAFLTVVLGGLWFTYFKVLGGTVP